MESVQVHLKKQQMAGGTGEGNFAMGCQRGRKEVAG